MKNEQPHLFLVMSALLSVENTSYRIAYLVMSFGLLASVAYRGFVLTGE